MKGHLRKRGVNVWAIVLELGRDPITHRRRQRWVTVHGNQRQAERRLSELVAEVNAGSYVEPSKLTVADFFERFFEDYAAPNLRERTVHNYRVLARAYLLPDLGNVPLERLSALQVQSLYTRLLREGGRRGGPLSPTTVRHVHRLLAVALKRAIRWQLLRRNPLEGVDPPSARPQPPDVLQDAGAVAGLLEAASGSWLSVPVVLAIGGGLCRGEVLALRWSDVDFAAGTVRIEHSLTQIGRELTETDPKNDFRKRTIALPRFALELLRAHRREQAAGYLAAGLHPPEPRLIVAHPDGAHRTPGSLTQAFADLAARAGCPGVTYHALRHTCATHLLNEGVEPHLVSRILGHSDVATTLRVYAHILREMRERSAVAMDALFPPHAGAIPGAGLQNVCSEAASGE